MIRTAFLITALVGLTACGGSQPSRNLEAAKSAPRATAISSVISSKSAKQLFGAERIASNQRALSCKVTIY